MKKFDVFFRNFGRLIFIDTNFVHKILEGKNHIFFFFRSVIYGEKTIMKIIDCPFNYL